MRQYKRSRNKPADAELNGYIRADIASEEYQGELFAGMTFLTDQHVGEKVKPILATEYA